MRIEFQCTDGSPLGVIPDDYWSRGVGGAEYALFELTRHLADRGHEVVVYNDPREVGEHDGVMYLPKSDWNPDLGADVYVLFRSPNTNVLSSKAPLKVFFSCDQYTIGDYARDIFPHVDVTVCISPRHRQYFMEMYGQDGEKITHIDLGVRLQDYERLEDEVQRVKNQVVFCSIPDRGLHRLRYIWDRITRDVPDVSIAITGDYRLWGGDRPGIGKHRRNWGPLSNVHYHGAVPRLELVKLQLQSDWHLYPCTYDELFCVSVAETQVAGAIPVTSPAGALKTTNEFGFQFTNEEGVEDPNDPGWLSDYSDLIVGMMTDDYESVTSIRDEMKLAARERFSWVRIAEKWEQLFEVGLE